MTAKVIHEGDYPLRHRPGRRYLSIICSRTDKPCERCNQCCDTQQATSSLTTTATMTAIAGNIVAATGITGSISAGTVAQKARISA
jgi:hypothetical protein